MLTLVVVALVLAACGGAPAPSDAPAMEMPMPMATAAPAREASDTGAALPVEGGAAQAPGQSQQPAGERLVIKNAEMAIQVERVREAEAGLRAKIAELGGYVVSSQNFGSDEEMSARVTFRVPAERFDAALSGVEGLANRVLMRSVSGDDVTEEFVDLGSRLRTLEATRDRMLELLARAESVEDALSVNQALTDVQGEIEQITGRMQYLRQSAALSTVSVDLRPVPVTPIITAGGWQPLEVARGALAGLVSFGQALVNLAIVVLVWTPLWLPLLLGGRFVLRRLLRPRRVVSQG
jgi:hypothetical protein